MSDASVIVTAQNVQEVLEGSRENPLLLLFWAAQVPESVEMKDTLEALVAPHAGKLNLGLVDVAEQQMLAQQLRVQALPSLKVLVEGQIATEANGPQPREALAQLIEQLTMSTAEKIEGTLDDMLAAGAWDQAIEFLQHALHEEPANAVLKAELADLLLITGRVDEGAAILADVAADEKTGDRPRERLAILREVEAQDVAALEARLAADADDHGARIALALVAAARGETAAALEELLVALRADRSFEEELPRRTMVRVLTLTRPGDPLAREYRKRMMNLLH